MVRLPLLTLHREVQDDVVLALYDDAADQTGHLRQVVILSSGGETGNNRDTDGLGKLGHFAVLTKWTGEDGRSTGRHGIQARPGQLGLAVQIKVEVLLTSGLPAKWSRVFVTIGEGLEVEDQLVRPSLDMTQSTHLALRCVAVLHYKLLSCPQLDLWKGGYDSWCCGFRIRALLYFRLG